MHTNIILLFYPRSLSLENNLDTFSKLVAVLILIPIEYM